jgi:hypothetical protein
MPTLRRVWIMGNIPMTWIMGQANERKTPDPVRQIHTAFAE